MRTSACWLGTYGQAKGSSGSPYSSFRFIQDIMSVRPLVLAIVSIK